MSGILEKVVREEWNMKKGILLVSFGSGNKEAVEETLGKLKKEAEERFPTYAIYQAFTSGQIREKWREIYQISVDSPEQAFRNMQRDGIEQVVVQPVYVVQGQEFEKVRGQVEMWRKQFRLLKFGKPLLSQEEDYKRCVHVIDNRWPAESGKSRVIVGYGTKESSQSAYGMLEYTFRMLGYSDVAVGTLSGYPAIQEVLWNLKQQKTETIEMIPFLLIRGEKAEREILHSETGWTARLQEEGYQVERVRSGLLELEEIRRILLDHIEEAIEE